MPCPTSPPHWCSPRSLEACCSFPSSATSDRTWCRSSPRLRQYAGNWASALWAFAPGAEAKLDHIVRGAGNTVDQLADSYPRPVADVLMSLPVAWRALHSQGPALNSMLLRHLGPGIDRYTMREAEFGCNTVIGFNFGDGHFHDEQLIAAIQRRCEFEPGEFVVAWVESQPVHRDHQDYKVIDAALGVIERGTYRSADSVAAQPWLPDGPIPLQETWSLSPGRILDVTDVGGQARTDPQPAEEVTA